MKVAGLVVLLVVIGVGYAFAQPGGPIVVPGHAVGDITLGMTQTNVLIRLGMPDEISNENNGDGSTNVFWLYPQEPERVFVISWTRKEGRPGGVDFIFTDSRRYVTSKGVQIGETAFAQVLEKYGPPDRIASSSRRTITFFYDGLGIRFRIDAESGAVTAVTVVPRKV